MDKYCRCENPEVDYKGISAINVKSGGADQLVSFLEGTCKECKRRKFENLITKDKT
tara:strand:+ start:516 stop:683 length:168 start_codon:yes stop_codon:yes gene_type:complete